MIEIDGNYIDFDDNANKVKWGLTNYLSSNCKLEKKYITVHPITWIINASSCLTSNNILIDKKFT